MKSDFDKYWDMIPSADEVMNMFTSANDSDLENAIANSKRIGALHITKIIKERMLNAKTEENETFEERFNEES